MMQARRPRTGQSTRSIGKINSANKVKSTILKGRPRSAKDWFEVCNRKKEQEALRIDDWKDTVDKLRKRELVSQFYNKPSRDTPKVEDSGKHGKLEERRFKLKKLLEREAAFYNEERSRRRAKTSFDNDKPTCVEVELLKKKLDDLKKKNEEERKRLSEKMSYEVWRRNNTDVRWMESERLNQFVRDAWIGQKEMKGDRRRWEEEEQKQFEIEEMKRQNLLAERRQLEEENRAKKLRDLKVLLDNQVKANKLAKERESRLQEIDAIMVKEKDRINQLILSRKKIEEQRKIEELEKVWARQHLLNLKKKSLTVQKQIIENLYIVEDLLRNRKDFESKIDGGSESLCGGMEEAEWLKGVFQEQKRLEMLREKEYDSLFSEEAEKVWVRRQKEWEKEESARNKLLKEILEGRKQQIEEQISRNEKELKKVVESKEQAAISVSNIEQHIKKEKDKCELDDIEETVGGNGSVEKSESVDFLTNRKNTESLDGNVKLQRHREEIKRLEEEMKRLWEDSYAPPMHGRKKVVW